MPSITVPTSVHEQAVKIKDTLNKNKKPSDGKATMPVVVSMGLDLLSKRILK
jgi:hypothetical protein